MGEAIDERAVGAPGASSHEAVFSQEPYMGVSCPAPNTIACDRVGLSVWLREPARRVDATIAGRPLALDDPQWSGPLESGGRRIFAGFLQPAGLIDGPLRVDRPPVIPDVRLRIRRHDGSVDTIETRVGLAPGWG
ncbi:MAG: hypothetical protein WD844_09190 [Thermoleophilaceae bacterium]